MKTTKCCLENDLIATKTFFLRRIDISYDNLQNIQILSKVKEKSSSCEKYGQWIGCMSVFDIYMRYLIMYLTSTFFICRNSSYTLGLQVLCVPWSVLTVSFEECERYLKLIWIDSFKGSSQFCSELILCVCL